MHFHAEAPSNSQRNRYFHSEALINLSVRIGARRPAPSLRLQIIKKCPRKERRCNFHSEALANSHIVCIFMQKPQTLPNVIVISMQKP